MSQLSPPRCQIDFLPATVNLDKCNALDIRSPKEPGDSSDTDNDKQRKSGDDCSKFLNRSNWQSLRRVGFTVEFYFESLPTNIIYYINTENRNFIFSIGGIAQVHSKTVKLV